MKNFENWETQDVEMTFGIVQEKKSTLLEDWLHAKTEITDQERQTLEVWREKLLYHADFWNEDELKLQFIAPLLTLIDYSLSYCKPVSQRKLTATIQDIHVGGWVDYMLASGKQKPIRPFFFSYTNTSRKEKEAQTPKGSF